MGYLQATRDSVLLLPPEGVLNDGCNRVLSFSDADHAGCLHTGKSTSGLCTFLSDLNGNRMLIDWGSKLQHGTAQSTPDAELSAVQHCVCRSSIPV